MCCFHSVCLLGGADGVRRLKCYGGGDGCCNGGLVSAFPFALVITFLKMLLSFILLLWSSMWFKKHLWDHKCEILLCFVTYVSKKISFRNGKYHFALSPMWIEEKPLANQQACMSFPFLFCMSQKNQLWARKCARSFLFFSCVSWKNHLQACKYTISFFFLLFCESKKPCVGSQMCNIIFSSPMWI